jgi:hypothetical protein
MDSCQILRLVWRDLEEISRLIKWSKAMKEKYSKHELGREYVYA